MQQFVGVEDDVVGLLEEAVVLGFQGALADLGHGDGHEHVLDVGERVVAGLGLGEVGGTPGEFLAAGAGGDEADACFDQADVGLQGGDPVGGVHDEFAAAAQGHALHRGHGGDLGVAQGHGGALELGDGLFQQVELAGLDGLGDLLQVGADGEGGLVPQDDAVQVPLGPGHGLDEAVQDFVADGVHLGFEGEDADAGIDLGQGPQAHAGVFPAGFAQGGGGFAEDGLGEELALVHRQGGAGFQGLFGGGPGAGGLMDAVAVEHPGGQRGGGHGAAGGDVGLDGLGDGGPAGGLPGLEGALGPAKAPAHGQVHVPGVVGDVGQVVGAVVEDVAEDGPEELGLFVAGGAQGGEFFGRALDLEDVGHFRGNLTGGGAVALAGQVEDVDGLAFFFEDAAAGLLPQGAVLNEGGEPGGGGKVGVPGVGRQGGLHGADDVGQGVQADHVGGAVGGALGPADLGAGEGVHFVEAEAEGLGVVHHRQDGEDADPVGDEVGGVLGAHDAFAQPGDEPGFEPVEGRRVGVPGGDQFDQVHVARRVEEVDAAEVGPPLGRDGGGQLVDGQARGVGGDDGASLQVGGDLAVEVFFPRHLFGDGFDHQVALAEQGEVLVVVGGVDVGEPLPGGPGRRVEFLEAVDGFLDDAVRLAFLGRQVEQHDRYVGVGQVRRNLRPHHPRPQNRRLAYY